MQMWIHVRVQLMVQDNELRFAALEEESVFTLDSFVPLIPLLSTYIPCTESGGLKSSNIIIELFILLFYQILLHGSQYSIVRCIYVHKCYVFLMD